MAISENETLFNLIGTTYGGDGQETFGLPDLRGRLPIHQGQGAGLSSRLIAESGGTESVTLTVPQLPGHAHSFLGSANLASALSPAGALVASPTNIDLYRPGSTTDQVMASNAISPVGGSQPHDNTQPFLCVSFIISLFGIFPTQN